MPLPYGETWLRLGRKPSSRTCRTSHQYLDRPPPTCPVSNQKIGDGTTDMAFSIFTSTEIQHSASAATMSPSAIETRVLVSTMSQGYSKPGDRQTVGRRCVRHRISRRKEIYEKRRRKILVEDVAGRHDARNCNFRPSPVAGIKDLLRQPSASNDGFATPGLTSERCGRHAIPRLSGHRGRRMQRR